MRFAKYALPAVLAIGLIITSVGWYLAASDDDDDGEATYRAFDTCTLQDGELELTFTYGANEDLSPSFEIDDDEIVVSLEFEAADGPTPMIALNGDVRFQVFGGQTVVRYPDGELLDCAAS